MEKKNKRTRIPLLAIVGRPNVGKSTLFNRLVGERRALVDDQPGVTRDRNYGRLEWTGQVWEIVDTGGFEPETTDDILRTMRRQTEFAIAQADGIIFLLDGKAGITPADYETANLLRRSGKPVFFAVNKIDGPRQEGLAIDFFQLGTERLFSVSAEHGYGVAELLDEIRATIPGAGAEAAKEESSLLPRVAVLGRPNVGKSTLINALLGEERLLVHPTPGTTRDAIDTRVRLAGQDYILVDTAGLRRKKRIEDRLERAAAGRALQSLERCHIALIVMDAREEIVDQDARIVNVAVDRGRAVALLFNKWDLLENKELRRREIETLIAERLPHASFAPRLTLSALHRQHLGKLPGLLQLLWEQYNQRLPTPELNRHLQKWMAEYPPPAPHGRAIKIHYAVQISVRPPTFVFFTNQPENIPAAYERFLINQLRSDFGFAGSPLRLLFRAGKKGKRRSG